MFTFLRGVMIVAVIFYFSPARVAQNTDGSQPPSLQPGTSVVLQEAKSGAFVRFWSRLVDSFVDEAVQEVVDDTTGALGLAGDADPSLAADAPWTAAASLQHRSPQEDAGQPVRCVYRCDGVE
jgi:hypothetical protein